MTRPKTKRIVWTLAVLLALSFVAVMVLHKHEEPRIIGNLSKEDAAEISKTALRLGRGALKEDMSGRWKQRKIRSLMIEFYQYTFDRVLTIEVVDSEFVRVTIGTKPGKHEGFFFLTRIDGHWVSGSVSSTK